MLTLRIPERHIKLTIEDRVDSDFFLRCRDMSQASAEIIGNRFSVTPPRRASWLRRESLAWLCIYGERERDDLRHGNLEYMPTANEVIEFYTDRYA